MHSIMMPVMSTCLGLPHLGESSIRVAVLVNMPSQGLGFIPCFIAYGPITFEGWMLLSGTSSELTHDTEGVVSSHGQSFFPVSAGHPHPQSSTP